MKAVIRASSVIIITGDLKINFNIVASYFCNLSSFSYYYIILYYQLYQLQLHSYVGIRGHTQKAKPVQGVYQNPRKLINKQPNKLVGNMKFYSYIVVNNFWLVIALNGIICTSMK